jgi:sensor domain CHASE-containing protein
MLDMKVIKNPKLLAKVIAIILLIFALLVFGYIEIMGHILQSGFKGMTLKF